MMDWAASSEMIVMLVVLGFLLVELVSIRRTIKRDRARLEAERRDSKL
jgi:hypothetical protein